MPTPNQQPPIQQQTSTIVPAYAQALIEQSALQKNVEFANPSPPISLAPEVPAGTDMTLIEPLVAPTLASQAPAIPATRAPTPRDEQQVVALVSTTAPAIAATAPTTSTASTASIPASRLVRLSIEGVRPGQGPVKVAIFTDEASFPTPAGASAVFSLNADTSTVASEVAVAGQFAVGVFQDINGDGELTVNRFGIPLEPFAFSNNAKGQRGPPKFADAAVLSPANSAASPMLVPINLP